MREKRLVTDTRFAVVLVWGERVVIASKFQELAPERVEGLLGS